MEIIVNGSPYELVMSWGSLTMPHGMRTCFKAEVSMIKGLSTYHLHAFCFFLAEINLVLE